MSVTRRDFVAVPATVAITSSAAATPQANRPAEGQLWARTELYFGTKAQRITETEFRHFIDKYVTARFPDGLTLLTAYGQFRNSDGHLIREKSYLLILLYPLDMQDASERIEAIRQRYKDLFNPESVLRVDSFSVVSF